MGKMSQINNLLVLVLVLVLVLGSYRFGLCQKINLTQKFKLLDKIKRYNLYYFLTHSLK
jgi:hypothetical protein